MAAGYNLNDLVNTYNIDNAYEQYKRVEVLDKLGGYVNLQQAAVLELGSASGQMTAMLSRMARQVVAVDGSSEFIRIARENTRDCQNVLFQESYFEHMTIDQDFDCVIMHHILEHIEHPAAVLPGLHRAMTADTVMVVTVPNAHALSRQLAVKMGLLESVYALTENDLHHGHFRVYDWATLEAEMIAAGFDILGRHGLSFKLLSDRQNIQMIEHGIIGEQQIRGLWALGDEFPALAGAIMLVVRKART